MTIPFASILIGTVLLRHARWKEIVLVSSLGSATGGLILYFTFYDLGYTHRRVSRPVQSKIWSDTTRWVSAYGTWALLGIAAMPLPQTPALIFTAVLPLQASEVFLALFVGKLLKYGTYGYFAAKCPNWFDHLTRETPFRMRRFGC